MFEIRMEYDDRALAVLRAFPQFAARAEKSAVSSAGYRIRAAMRRFIWSGGEGRWPKSVALEYGEQKRVRKPLQALAAMVYYGLWESGGHPVAKIYPDMDLEWRMRMLKDWMTGRTVARRSVRGAPDRLPERKRRIGHEAPSPARFFRKAEEGAVYTVTEKMRRAMALMGMPMRKTTAQLVVPPPADLRPGVGEGAGDARPVHARALRQGDAPVLDRGKARQEGGHRLSDLAEVTAQIRDLLKADAGITAWCQQKYGKLHKLYVGMDEEAPPAETDYPLIAILPVEHAWGIKSRTESSTVFIFCGIVQRTVATAGNVVELAGISEIETLRRMVEERLFKAGLLVAESRAESKSENYFPVFIAGSIVTIETKLSSRHPTAG